MLKIKDLPVAGPVEVAVLVAEMKSGDTKTGGHFCRFTFKDDSGSLVGIAFEGSKQLAETVEVGGVYVVSGSMGTHDGSPQIKVSGAEPLEGADAMTFAPRSRFPADGMLKTINGVLDFIKDEPLRNLVKAVMDDPDFAAWSVVPAGIKVHHEYLHGLLEHMIEMCRLVIYVSKTFNYLNSDLLIAGCILHDIGKSKELTVNGAVFEYTATGSLGGHIYECIAKIEKHAPACGVSDLTKLHLIHLVLSHHGKLEFGALQVPRTAEAIVLSAVDQLSASLNQCQRFTDALPDGKDLTEFNYTSRVQYVRSLPKVSE